MLFENVDSMSLIQNSHAQNILFKCSAIPTRLILFHLDLLCLQTLLSDQCDFIFLWLWLHFASLCVKYKILHFKNISFIIIKFSYNFYLLSQNLFSFFFWNWSMIVIKSLVLYCVMFWDGCNPLVKTRSS